MAEKETKHANVIENPGSPMDKCVGFIDHIKIQIILAGRHNTNYRSVYSGQTTFHGMVYQSITKPDGLNFTYMNPRCAVIMILHCTVEVVWMNSYRI